jgi:hypothetical protein
MNQQFSEMVSQAFSFLEDAGFRRTEANRFFVVYESARSFVSIGWDQRSGELNAHIGLSPRTERARDQYSIADVLEAAGLPLAECKPAQIYDEYRLAPFVMKLAESLRAHSELALVGDRQYFCRLESFRSAKAAAHMRHLNLNMVRTEVEKAWRDQQYDKVVSLYKSVESDLTESELRKLEYARGRRFD